MDVTILNELSKKQVDYQSLIEKLLNQCTHHQQVAYAYHVAKSLDKYYNTDKNKDVYKARVTCLELVAKWLIDPTSVKKKDLDAAASAAANAAYAAAYAAYAASYAVYAAAHAANAASAAAHAAAYAAGDYNNDVYETEMKKWLLYLLETTMEMKTVNVLALVLT